MNRYKCIVCPVDFSPCSRIALQYAASLAKHFQARLLVHHVLAPLNLSYYNYLLPGGPEQEFELEMQRHASETLGAFTEEVLRGEAVCEAVMTAGSPLNEIVELARKNQAELLIMGTHGRSGFERFLLGSVTEKVLRKSPCPVLVVRCFSAEGGAGERPAHGEYRKILVPLDLSEHSAQTLHYAVEFAREYQAAMCITHVLEQPTSPSIDPSYTGMLLDCWTEVMAEAGKILEDLVRQNVHGQVPEEHWVAVGRPANEILRAAEERKADLIIMGAKHSLLAGLGAIGTTAHRVIGHASCPVLFLR
jgi:nucleotide-binding universal stress UspA family protein